MTDIAKLVFEIDSTQAVQARKNLDDLTKSSDRVETSARKVRTASEQAGIGISSNSSATARATKTATEHAMAMSQAEKVMRGALVTRGESITLLLRNSQVQAKAAADEIAAAKSAASATAKAEQERAAAWRRSQAVQAEIMRERVALAKQAEQQEIAAAKSAANYAAKVDRLRATLDPFAAIQTTLAQRTKLLDDALRAGAIGADQHAAMLSRVTKAATSGVLGLEKYSGGLKNGGQYATQFSYQLNDIVTGLMSGQKPMQVLAQQGGQLFQIFQMAAMEAGGFRAAIKAMYAEILPLLAAFAPWIAGLLAVGAAVALVAKAHNDHMKRIDAVNKSIDEMQKKLADTVPWLDAFTTQERMAKDGSAAFYDWLEKKAKGMANYAANTRAATLALLNQQSIEAAANAQKLRAENLKTNTRGVTVYVGRGSLFGGVNSDGYKKYIEEQAKADRVAATAQKLLAEAMKAPNEAFVAQTGNVRTATAAVRQHTKEIELNNETVSASTVVWPEAAAAAEAYKKQQDAVKAAANDNIKTMQEQIGHTVHFSSTLEKLAYDLEDAAAVSRNLGYDIEDIARAINDNDWTSAFAGMARVLLQVSAAFEKGATSAQKYAAAAAVAGAVGGAVGGTAGATISGAASGAMAGFTLGGPAGAVVGGIIGGIGGIFGSSSAKKKARQQAAAQAAAEEAQRQQTIADTEFALNVALLRAQGEETKATNMERDKEIARLAAISQASADLQKQLWALDDAATATAKAAEEAAAAAEKAAAVEARRSSIQGEIDKMTMTSAELLAKTREKERAEAVALDPALGALIDQLFGLQDAVTATAAASAQAAADSEAAAKAFNADLDRQNEAMAAAADAENARTSALQTANQALGDSIKSLEDLTKSLNDFANSLNFGDLSGNTLGSQYDFAKQNLLSAKGDQIPEAAKAFLDIAKERAGTSLEYGRDVTLAQSVARTGASAAIDQIENIKAAAPFFAAMTSGNQAEFDRLLRGGNLPGFANGGALTIGGNSGTDQNLLSINGQPQAWVSAGETVGIHPRGGANDNSDTAALRTEVAELRGLLTKIANSNDKMERTLTNVTQGGRAMQTEAAS